MKKIYRGLICKIEILKGEDVLLDGQEKARRLYNFARYCAIGHNRKCAKARGDYSLKGKLPKYPGAIGMQNALRDTEEYQALRSRVAEYVIRGFDAQMRSWFSNLKSNPKARPPRYADKFPSLTFEIGHSAKWYDDGLLRLTVLSVKTENRHVYARIYHPDMTDRNSIESIKILDDGRCAVSYKTNVKSLGKNRVAAIDLGIRNIAALAFDNLESILYSGGAFLSEQRYFQKEIARCMPSGWNGKGDGRKLPRVGKLPEYYQQWNEHKTSMLHSMTTSIIDECLKREIGTIVVGDLKGIRDDKDFGKSGNQKLHAWPFAKIVEMLKYKAEEVGIRIAKISERNTSKTCSVCGHINHKSARKVRGMLTCSNCGAEVNADVNGAFNILQKYLRDESLGVAACLPSLPSPTATASGIGTSSQVALSGNALDETKRDFANRPTFVAKFDLRNFAVKLQHC